MTVLTMQYLPKQSSKITNTPEDRKGTDLTTRATLAPFSTTQYNSNAKHLARNASPHVLERPHERQHSTIGRHIVSYKPVSAEATR